MQTVLAGQDGKTPAIDATTGQPLTMEEMLRRRGIVAAGNNVSMLGPQAAPQSNAVASPTSAVAAAMAARNGSGAVANPAITASTTPAKGGDPASTDVPPIDPAQVAQMEQLEASGADEGSISTLEGLGLVAGGTAAAYGAYLAWKGMRNGNGTNPAAIDLGGVSGNRNPQIIEGEFSEVPRVTGPAKMRTIGATERKALPAPQKRIANNSRTAVAKVKQQQAARGTSGNDVINAQQAPRTIREAPEAGLARTLGGDNTSEVLKVLKKNPGLAKLLATGL